MSIDIEKLTIQEAKKLLSKREVSSRELCEATLKKIEEKEKDIHAYVEVFSNVLQQADEADRKRNDGEASPLLGIPLAIKDNILIEGRVASASSKILEKYRATYSATAIKKLQKAGTVFIGRTNMDEFAMGGSTENSAFGATKNPHDLSRVPGGSSGGSAAAVASGEALGALGSDTGGSIRQPAAFCGIVGLKPTYGKVSRHGLMAMGSSLDQIGPMTKTVTDAELLFTVISGNDSLDSTSGIYEKEIPKIQKKKIVVPQGIQKGLHQDMEKNFNESIEKFKTLGYEVTEKEFPHLHLSLPSYYVLMPAEVSANMSRYDGIRFGLHVSGGTLLEDYEKTRHEGFGKEVRRRIMLGTYVLSSGYYDDFYKTANSVRALIAKDFQEAFEDASFVLMPTTPTPPFALGEKTEDPLTMYLSDIFTVSANLVGIPAISLPSGFSQSNGVKLPLGIQLLSSYNNEEALFRAGKEFLNEQ